MTVPQIRLSPSGPPVENAAIVAGGMGPFATSYRRSGNNLNYVAPATVIGDPFPERLESTPVVVVPYYTQLTIDLPTQTPEPGFEFWLSSKFNATARVAATGAATDTRIATRIEYLDETQDPAAWVPLSVDGSGTQIVTAPDDGNFTLASHALRERGSFQIAEDQTNVSIRVAWGMLGGEENTTVTVDGAAADQEGVSGGWDWSSAWVLCPADQV